MPGRSPAQHAAHVDPWVSGWEPGRPPAITAVLVRNDGSGWEGGFRAEFEYRDLGLTEATDGVMVCRHVRRRGAGLIGFGWHCHDTDFQFNFVLAGTSRVENNHGAHHTLGPGDVICEPGLFPVREFDFSEDYDVIQIGVPAERRETILGRDSPLPPRAQQLNPNRATVYSSSANDPYSREPAPNEHFERRDLGTGDPTGGRVRLSLVRTPNSPGAGALEYHSSAQWLLMLGAAAVLERETGPTLALERLDAISLPGPGPHVLRTDGPGFEALELHVAGEPTG